MYSKIGFLQRGFGLIKRFFITVINECKSGPDNFWLIKRTERNKQFVMSESTKKTKARKHDHSWASAEVLPGGKVDILFIIFKLLTISVPSKIILH